MANIQQKSEKISAFGGIFFVLDKIDRILSSVIDSHLGLRSRLIGYQSARLYGPAQHRAGRMMTINALSTSIRPSTSPLSAASRRNMLLRPPTTPSSSSSTKWAWTTRPCAASWASRKRPSAPQGTEVSHLKV